MGQEKNILLRIWPVYLLLLVAVLVGFWLFAQLGSASERSATRSPVVEPASAGSQTSVAENKPGSPAAAVGSVENSKKDMASSLWSIILARKTWDAIWTDWYGKKAPNFSFADLAGQDHQLSDYAGKDILLVFWATWCGPCRSEIPDLVKLTNTMDREEFVIIAVSSEPASTVKAFVKMAKINYTAVSMQRPLPAPYASVDAIPSSCFIDKQGNIKIATVGVLPIDEVRAILKAK